MKLSILICTLPERSAMLNDLIDNIAFQINTAGASKDVEVLTDPDTVLTVGEKRNNLLKQAKGDYLCFIDDDDEIAANYLVTILQALESNPDCCSLRGEITFDGKNPEIFEHSLMYDKWRTVEAAEIKYERYPTPLNTIKSSIAKQFEFPNVDFGEDHKWAEALHKSKLLKREAYIPSVLYFYKFITIKPKRR